MMLLFPKHIPKWIVLKIVMFWLMASLPYSLTNQL